MSRQLLSLGERLHVARASRVSPAGGVEDELARALTHWSDVLWFRVFRLAALFHLFALVLLCVGSGRASVVSERDLIAARSATPELALQCTTARAPLRLRLDERLGPFQLPAPSSVELLSLHDPARVVVLGVAPESPSRLVDHRALIRQLRRSQHRPPAHADA